MNDTNRVEDWLGKSAMRRVRISSEMLDHFAELSGDRSPLHMSDGGAQARGFAKRVAHGMMLGSLVGGLMGMELPGENGVTYEVHLSFRNPCFVDDEVVITLKVADFFESVQVLELNVTIARADGLILATGKTRSGLNPRGGPNG